MNIITKVPQVNDGAVGRALERELRTGLKLREKTEREREAAAAREARAMKGHKTIKGLGKKLSSIPAWEWFRLNQKYGHEEVHSREFQKYLYKTHPHLFSHRP